MTANDTATVLRIGERFFAKTAKDGRLQTAWSLTGAKMFAPWRPEPIEAAERLIHSKGKTCERVTVTVASFPQTNDIAGGDTAELQEGGAA